MKIAVVNEVSQKAKNKVIVEALERKGYEVINAGMTGAEDEPELGYIETGLISALLLNAGACDYVIGGCGTGQGYLNSVMQYPGVFCGLINDPLDAWLFRQINGGNCLSLALAKGYGWAGEVNVDWIIDSFFGPEEGAGYPEERKIPQKILRETLTELSDAVKKNIEDVIKSIPAEILKRAVNFPKVMEYIRSGSQGKQIAEAIERRLF